jgi:hypothetical protein
MITRFGVETKRREAKGKIFAQRRKDAKQKAQRKPISFLAPSVLIFAPLRENFST